MLLSRILRAFKSALKPPSNTKLELEAIWSETIFHEVGKAHLSNLEIPLVDHLKMLRLPDAKQQFLNNDRSYSDQQIADAKKTLMEAIDPLKGVPIQYHLSEAQDRIM